MPAPVSRVSITVSPIDHLLVQDLADLTGQSLSAVASRALSEWIVEHYHERKAFYLKAMQSGLDSKTTKESPDQISSARFNEHVQALEAA